MKIFRTVQEIAEWIDQNIDPDKLQQTSLQTAIWFCALTEAEQMREMSLGDIAELLSGGIPKVDEEFINNEMLPTHYAELMYYFDKTELVDVPSHVDDKIAHNIYYIVSLEDELKEFFKLA